MPQDLSLQEYSNKLFATKQWQPPFFHTTFKHQREVMGLSQEDMATSIGVCCDTIGCWEKAVHYPSLESQYKIAAFIFKRDKESSKVLTDRVVQIVVDPVVKGMIPCPQEGYVSWATTHNGQCYQVQMPISVYEQIKIDFTSWA